MINSELLEIMQKITSATGHYDSPFGRISAQWENINDIFIYKLQVPTDIECEFDFSDMQVLESNKYGNTYSFRLK